MSQPPPVRSGRFVRSRSAPSPHSPGFEPLRRDDHSLGRNQAPIPRSVWKAAHLPSMGDAPTPDPPSPPRRMDAIDHPAVSSRPPKSRYISSTPPKSRNHTHSTGPGAGSGVAIGAALRGAAAQHLHAAKSLETLPRPPAHAKHDYDPPPRRRYRLKRVEHYAPESEESSSSGSSSDSSFASSSSSDEGHRHKRSRRRRSRFYKAKHKHRRKYKHKKHKHKHPPPRDKSDPSTSAQWWLDYARQSRASGVAPTKVSLTEHSLNPGKSMVQRVRGQLVRTKAGRAAMKGKGPPLNMLMAAVIIQTAYRGYLARRSAGVEIAMARAQRQRVTLALVVEMVDDLIVGDFIPDILLEVFTSKSNGFDSMSAEERAIHGAADDIVSDVVGLMTHRVVRSTVKELIDSMLLTKRTYDKHPLMMVVDDVVNETVHDLVSEATTSTVHVMVEQFLMTRRAEVWIDGELDSLMATAAAEAMQEAEEADAMDSLLSEVVGPMVSLAVEQVVVETRAEKRMQERLAQEDVVGRSSERIVHVAALRMLLATLATRANTVARQQACNRMLQGMMLRHLMARAHQLSIVRETNENTFMRSMHEHVTSRMTTALLVKLMSNTLDYDEAQLHEREVADDLARGTNSHVTSVLVAKTAATKLKTGLIRAAATAAAGSDVWLAAQDTP